MKVTLGELFDKLSICNIKIFHLENVKRNSNDNNEIAEATKKTNSLNSERNCYIEEIDLALNNIAMGERQQIFGSNKMYG